MGNSETAKPENQNSVAAYWQERPVKYALPGGELFVEEVKTPWDLFAEGRWLNNPVGTEFHQILVKNGVERVFSIRNKDGYPYCDILTRPSDAPIVSVDWAPYRGLKTSCPMIVDGQKLIVLDVIVEKGRRAKDLYLKWAKDFFVSQGGTLRGEHPTSLAFPDNQAKKEWHLITNKNLKADLLISTKLIKDKEADTMMRSNVAHASNVELAILLLRSRYWHRCVINGEEEWTEEVVSHMEETPDDQPDIINVWGKSPHAHAIFDRIKIMYEKELIKKK